ncbi:hypothetical protein HYW74_01820, partial [Candidatus Pacearchaeota archaeon]|nr:hypothetical protein [Candidatus Pacearchaeota archaeon]
MTKIIMANNNKWLLYGFIILAILNIILLGYIVMGLSGKSVGLSPSGPASYCTDTSTGTFCFIGDKDGPTALELFRSKIIDSGTDY